MRSTGKFGPDASLDVVAAPNLDVLHPLTGPVYIEGAEPGDLLDVEILDIEPDRYGYTVEVPGFGFLRDRFPEPFKVSWDIAGGWRPLPTSPGCASPARRSWASSACPRGTSCSPPLPPGNRRC